MKIKVEIWPISALYEIIETVNEQPEYQRGEVWKDRKKSLLIDSILRGIDIPKIFLRRLRNSAFQYEVADGQQRISAIVKFRKNELKLRDDVVNGLDLNIIENQIVGGKHYDELPTPLKKKFDSYELTVAVLEQVDNDEVRTLFGRLQLGESLSPAEKRNAIISSIGNCIDNFSMNHQFFIDSKISKARFKHQDYLAHVFALIAYDNHFDLKADLLEKLYLENPIRITQAFQRKITQILDLMHAIDHQSKARIVNKFAFVDIFWFLFTEYDNYSHVQIDNFARRFEKFESLRLENNKEPEKLILEDGSEADKDLYSYITSFNFAGSKPSSISTRNRVFKKIFKRYLS